MADHQYYARYYTSRGKTILAKIDSGTVGAMTSLGGIELQQNYLNSDEVSVRSPDGHRLVLIPEAANVVQVKVEGISLSRESIVPSKFSNRAIESIIDALDRLRQEASLQVGAAHSRTKAQREKNATRIYTLCNQIQEALAECVTG